MFYGSAAALVWEELVGPEDFEGLHEQRDPELAKKLQQNWSCQLIELQSDALSSLLACLDYKIVQLYYLNPHDATNM